MLTHVREGPSEGEERRPGTAVPRSRWAPGQEVACPWGPGSRAKAGALAMGCWWGWGEQSICSACGLGHGVQPPCRQELAVNLCGGAGRRPNWGH